MSQPIVAVFTAQFSVLEVGFVSEVNRLCEGVNHERGFGYALFGFCHVLPASGWIIIIRVFTRYTKYYDNVSLASPCPSFIRTSHGSFVILYVPQ